MSFGLKPKGAPSAGKRLGRYELLVPIGTGGMANVWVARLHGQRGFSRLFALKAILPELASTDKFEQMFIDEARIAARIYHPNVCAIHELGEEAGMLYVAMDWVDGDSLQKVLRPKKRFTPIDPRIASKIVAEVCAGIHAAHELASEDGVPLGLVHRDVTPHNILMSSDGGVKVTDFGIAKVLGQFHEQTRAGELKGKLQYMSPEQLQGWALDRRADIFSVGCTLYEMTVGTPPFDGANEAHLMKNIMSCVVKPPSDVVPSFPKPLEAILMRSLAKEPGDRFATAEAMVDALEMYLSSGGKPVLRRAIAELVTARVGDEALARTEAIRRMTIALEEGSNSGTRERRERNEREGRDASGARPLPLSVPLPAPNRGGDGGSVPVPKSGSFEPYDDDALPTSVMTLSSDLRAMLPPTPRPAAGTGTPRPGAGLPNDLTMPPGSGPVSMILSQSDLESALSTRTGEPEKARTSTLAVAALAFSAVVLVAAVVIAVWKLPALLSDSPPSGPASQALPEGPTHHAPGSAPTVSPEHHDRAPAVSPVH